MRVDPLREWNVAHRFLQWATNAPDLLAVHDGNVSLTYRELERRCLALATLLQTMRQEADRDVALVVDRSCDLVVGLIAAMLSALPCLVLSPFMWREELARAVAGRMVLTQRRLESRFPGERILLLDQPEALRNGKSDPRARRAQARDVAITLQSTAESIPHAALASMVDALAEFSLPATRVVQSADISSRRFLVEIWSALARGGAVHMVPTTLTAESMSDGLPDGGADATGSLCFVLTSSAAAEIIADDPRILGATSSLLLLGDSDVGSDALRAFRRLAAKLPLFVGVDAPGHPLVILARVVPSDVSSPVFAVGKPVGGVVARTMSQDCVTAKPRNVGELWVYPDSGDPLPTGWHGRIRADGGLELMIGEDVGAPELPVDEPPRPERWTSTGRRVAAIWQQLLNADRVAPESDFFELGGSSLLAMRMIARVNAEFGTNLAWVIFLREPSVANLAAAIDSAMPSHNAALSAGR